MPPPVRENHEFIIAIFNDVDQMPEIFDPATVDLFNPLITGIVISLVDLGG